MIVELENVKTIYISIIVVYTVSLIGTVNQARNVLWVSMIAAACGTSQMVQVRKTENFNYHSNSYFRVTCNPASGHYISCDILNCNQL